MSDFFKKAMGFIGLPIEEDENTNENEKLEFDTIKPKREPAENHSLNPKKNKVISVHTTTQLKVVVRTPLSFENAKDIADHLKAKKPVVVNLENVDVPIAKRIIDFLSGAVYAVDGNIQKIADKIFLIAPYSVGIIGGDIKDELKNKIVFPYGN